MSQHLTEFIKGQIIAYKEQGCTLKTISEKLSIPLSTVGKIVKKYQNIGTTERLPGSGRKNIFSNDEKNLLINISNKNPRKKASELRKDITKITKKEVSKRTVGRILNDHGLIGRKAKKKPLLSKNNMVKRYELSKAFLGY